MHALQKSQGTFCESQDSNLRFINERTEINNCFSAVASIRKIWITFLKAEMIRMFCKQHPLYSTCCSSKRADCSLPLSKTAAVRCNFITLIFSLWQFLNVTSSGRPSKFYQIYETPQNMNEHVRFKRNPSLNIIKNFNLELRVLGIILTLRTQLNSKRSKLKVIVISF